ncbi:MAG: crossover junction endodeoxyribonuclease RuvC [Acidobacteria bacterium]|nr:crossover junction endodeoxyribonuclease RuvC [Acidobacteriota bacterium]
MIVLGIDPGTRVTGYGIIRSDGRRHECLTYGCIRRPPQQDFPRSLRNIHDTFQSILIQYRPDVVAVETLFHAINARSALLLGHARGVILLCAALHDIPLHEYTPLEIKKAIVGYGRAEKTQLQHMAKLLLNLKQIPEPHDAADALAVAVCHAHHHVLKDLAARDGGKQVSRRLAEALRRSRLPPPAAR